MQACKCSLKITRSFMHFMKLIASIAQFNSTLSESRTETDYIASRVRQKLGITLGLKYSITTGEVAR